MEYEIRKRLKNMGASNFELISERFTDLPPNDDRVRRCKVVVCNPPCSKSGVVNPVDFILHEGVESSTVLSSPVTSKQMQKIIEEQMETLRHAMKFTSCQYVVYATHSVHEAENEKLVKKVISEQPEDIGKSTPYELAPFLQELVNELRSSVELNTSDREEQDLVSGKASLQFPISSYMDGFFIALLKRKVKEETVREIMDRAQKKGLISKKAGKSPKKSSAGKTTKKPSKKIDDVNPLAAVPSSKKPPAKNPMPDFKK